MATTSATPRSVEPALAWSAPPLIAAGSVLLLGAVARWLAVDRQAGGR